MKKSHLEDQVHKIVAESNFFVLRMTLRFVSLIQDLPQYAAVQAISNLENTALLQGKKNLLRRGDRP